MSVIFYSKNCSNCLEFLKKLKDEQMLNHFDEFFCVDNRNVLPTFLHSIPTIIVPDSDKPLVGDDAFAWLTYKMSIKYKKSELGTLDAINSNSFCDITKDPTDINLDSVNYISIENIDKPIKPQINTNINNTSMDVNKRFEELQQQRSLLLQEQKPGVQSFKDR